MKLNTVVVSFAIITIILSGCNNQEASEKVKDESKNNVKNKSEYVQNGKEVKTGIKNKESKDKIKGYETVKLENDDEGNKISIKYPKFSYKPIDKIIEKERKSDFEFRKEERDEIQQGIGASGFRELYGYTMTFEEPLITKDFVSFYSESYLHTGGAHGTPYANSFNFDLKNNQIITLDDVLEQHSTTLEAMSKIVAEKIIHDDSFTKFLSDSLTDYDRQIVSEETEAIEDNYSEFTLTENSIIFHKSYYQITSLAEGIIPVEILWTEVEEYMDDFKSSETGSEELKKEDETVYYDFGDSVKPLTSLNYENDKYGFKFKLPESWKEKYIIQEIDIADTNFVKTPSTVLAFSRVEDGKFIGDVFVLAIIENESANEIMNYYKNGSGYETVVDNGDDLILIFEQPGQMPTQVYEYPFKETGDRLAKMIGSDLPNIRNSVKFQ